MKFVLLVFAGAFLTGCATHNQQTITAVRAAGVSDRTVAKLEHRGVLAPSDLIELHRRGVDDRVPVRQLDKVGVDYVAQRDDFRRLRSAGVHPVVNDALLVASRRFVRDYYAPPSYYDAYYGDPWSYGGPWWWPFAGLSVGYSWGHWRGGDHGWHGGHGHHH